MGLSAPATLPAGQDEAMVARTLAFMVVRQILGLVGLGPSFELDS
jgi:hypothetical protein